MLHDQLTRMLFRKVEKRSIPQYVGERNTAMALYLDGYGTYAFQLSVEKSLSGRPLFTAYVSQTGATICQLNEDQDFLADGEIALIRSSLCVDVIFPSLHQFFLFERREGDFDVYSYRVKA